MTEFIVVTAFLCLVAICGLQHYTLHRLVNKLMSRNYHEYEQAIASGRPREEVKIQDGFVQDLRPMGEYQPF